MTLLRRSFLFAAAVLMAAPSLPAQQKVANGAKILLLSGGQRNHHAYRRQAQLLQKVLEETKQFEVTICEDAAVLEAPGINKYDVIVATADRRDPEFKLTDSQQRALLKYVDGGKGFFSLHGFCCADKDWMPDMRDLLGGVLAHFGSPDTKVKVGNFPIKIADPNHPITKGLADFEHPDELYYYLQINGELHPLVTATYQGQDWPILWARNFGKGKTCVSVFGHCGMKPTDKDPLEHEPFQKLIVRAIAWTAGREVK